MQCCQMTWVNFFPMRLRERSRNLQLPMYYVLTYLLVYFVIIRIFSKVNIFSNTRPAKVPWKFIHKSFVNFLPELFLLLMLSCSWSETYLALLLRTNRWLRNHAGAKNTCPNNYYHHHQKHKKETKEKAVNEAPCPVMWHGVWQLKSEFE